MSNFLRFDVTVIRRIIAPRPWLGSLMLLSSYLGRSFTQVVILWVLAHEAGPSGSGQFAFAVAVSTPVFVVCELALRNVYQTIHDPPSFRVLLGIRAACACLAVVCVIAVSAVVAGFPPSEILVPVLAMKFADSVLDICMARFLVEGRIAVGAAYFWTNTLLTIGAICVTLVAGMGATSAIVSSALASALVAAVAVMRLIPQMEPVTRPIGVQIRRVVRAGVTLGGAQALWSLLAYLPTFYLRVGATTAAVGVFAVCQYTVTLANLFFNSAMQTWLSRLRSAFVTDGRPALDRQWRRVAVYITGSGMLGGILVLVLAAPIIERVFGDKFAISFAVVLPLAIVVVLGGVEYSASAMLLVLNLYGTRVVGGLIGLVVAIAVAAATLSHAGLVWAGCVALTGAAARCLYSVGQLVRNRRSRALMETAVVE